MSDKFKILVADKLAQDGLDFVCSQPDALLTNKPGISKEQLGQIIGQHDGVIIRSGVEITAEVLANPGELKAIVRAGVGVDNIDLEAATSHGIMVMNSAQASTITTAEHAFALMMAMARNIGQAHKTMADGGWDRQKFQGRQLAGKTLGIVGFGRIGQTIAQRAMAFDMPVVAYDPFYNAQTAMDGRVKMYSQFEELLPHVDIVTFHVPLNDQTRGMLSERTFGLARRGLLVVNASRGGIVDEAALLAAVESGQCSGAAMDVFTTEPPPSDSPLRNHDRILLTPHLGASTVEAQIAVSVDAAVSLLAYLRGEGIHGAVNAGGLSMDINPVQERFVDLARRMACLISPLLKGGIARATFEFSGPALDSATSMIERMALIELLRCHMDVPLNIVNVLHIAEQRGIELRTVKVADDKQEGPKLTLEVDSGDRSHRIVGCVYHDMRPRVVEIDGYRMDMVPSGAMILILNEDMPGMIGLVGTELGQAQVNIADMAISRCDQTALMVLKVDMPLSDSLIKRLRDRPGIIKVAGVNLPDERPLS